MEKSQDHKSQAALVLIGDSTLDNIVWVDKYENCTKAKVQAQRPDIKVYNFAVDGFRSSDVLAGGTPLISYAKRKQFDPFPTEPSCKLYPLEELKKIPEPTKYVVLSIGGNDLRGILSSPVQMAEESQKFINNYMSIVDEILKVTGNLALMMQYRPSRIQQGYNIYQALEMLPGSEAPQFKMNSIMQKVYAPIVQKAKLHNLPMIDLPNTFDIYNDKLYVNEIEPSALGGDLISKLITHTIDKREHAFFRIDLDGQLQRYVLEAGAQWKVFIDASYLE